MNIILRHLHKNIGTCHEITCYVNVGLQVTKRNDEEIKYNGGNSLWCESQVYACEFQSRYATFSSNIVCGGSLMYKLRPEVLTILGYLWTLHTSSCFVQQMTIAIASLENERM